MTSLVSTHVHTVSMPAPFQDSPYRFIVQVTNIGAKTSMIWAGLGSVQEGAGLPVEPSLTSLDEDAGSQEQNEYQKALAEASEDGPADGLVAGDATTKETLRIGSRNLGLDWSCAMPSRLVSW